MCVVIVCECVCAVIVCVCVSYIGGDIVGKFDAVFVQFFCIDIVGRGWHV